ncbi:MAG: RNA polymerase sigma factor [Nitrospirales bacterium]|nr:MAG: RNA polymerase sigma factor [Nitrospirales bacterium]
MFLSVNLEDLFHSYHHSLLTYLRGLVKCSHFAEELAQETYLRLHTSVPATTTVMHPRAYLFRTAHNLAMDQQAKRTAEWKHRIFGGIPADLPCSLPQPDGIADSRQRLQSIANALNELPDACRQAFILHKFHGMTHAEIAQTLGVSKSMVEKHLMRALAHCRIRLREQAPTSF